MSALDKQEGGSHYKDMAIQPVEFIVANNIPFREANVIKYVSRWQDKGGLEDLQKARHYLDMIIEDVEPETEKFPEGLGPKNEYVENYGFGINIKGARLVASGHNEIDAGMIAKAKAIDADLNPRLVRKCSTCLNAILASDRADYCSIRKFNISRREWDVETNCTDYKEAGR